MRLEARTLSTGTALMLMGLLATAPAIAQQIDLSDVAAGTGGFAIDGEQTGDWLSRCSGAGDFNGDGYADLIVSGLGAGPNYASPYAPFGYFSPGRAYVILGRSAMGSIDLSGIAAAPSTHGFAITGEDTGLAFGEPVSGLGDVNGDGLSDILIVDSEASTAFPNGGRAYVVFGTTSMDSFDASELATGSSPRGFVIDGESPTLTSLKTLKASAAGDVNGDGLDDILLGAFSTNAYNGRAYVVFGKSSSQAVALSALVAGTSPLGFAIDGPSPSSQFGASVAAAGDVNGDDLDDVIIGSPFWDGPSAFHAGRAYVVFGQSTTTRLFASDIASGTSSLGFAIQTSRVGDVLGGSVASAGDANGDGLSDVLVVARQSIGLASSNFGMGYVVFGKSTGTTVLATALEAGSSPEGFAIRGWVEEDLGFRSSSAGDVNGDGLGDVLIGASFASPPTGDVAGRAYVVLGKSSPALVELSLVVTNTSGMGFAISGQQLGDKFGFGVATAGDIDGDGLDDLVAGAYGASTLGRTQNGRVYVIFSPYSLPAPLNGDADGDGALNVADLTAIHNQLAGIAMLPSGGDGDVDDDSDVDLDDAAALREFLVNGAPLAP